MLPWHKLAKRRSLLNINTTGIPPCRIGTCCLNCYAACGFDPFEYPCSGLDAKGEPLDCNEYNKTCNGGSPAPEGTQTCNDWPSLDACDCEPWFIEYAGPTICCETERQCNRGNDCGEYGDDATKCDKGGIPQPTVCYQQCSSGIAFQINPLASDPGEGYQTATQQATANGPTTNKGCPLTSKFRAGLSGGGAWTCRIENAGQYPTSGSCDPAYGFMTVQKRYGKTPKSPSAPPVTYGFGTLCIRKNTHSNWVRTLMMSGYNRYNYAGYWSNDPALIAEDGCRYENEVAFADLFKGWIPEREFIQGVQLNYSGLENPNLGWTHGCTGVATLERSLGRSWPLPDTTMQFPLWGAAGSEGRGATYGFASLHDQCWGVFFPGGGRTGHVCYGPDCLGLVDNEGVGHYLPGTTANIGYHSFSCFNPHALWRSQNLVVPFPTCSLWSLVQSVYDQTWRYTVRQTAVISTTATEAEWVTWLSANYPGINTKLTTLRQRRNNLLAADPSGLTNGVSNVSWYLGQFAQAIESYRRDVHAIGTGFLPHFGPHGSQDLDHFTVPQVFLWDKTNYKNASAGDKWKHLYIPGSANIFFDSGCTNTGEEWRAFKTGYDETCHDMSWGGTSQSQIIQFRVARDSSTEVNVIADTQLEILDLACVDRVLTGAGGDWSNDAEQVWCKMCAPKCPYGFDQLDTGFFCSRIEDNYYLGMERTRSCTGCAPCAF